MDSAANTNRGSYSHIALRHPETVRLLNTPNTQQLFATRIAVKHPETVRLLNTPNTQQPFATRIALKHPETVRLLNTPNTQQLFASSSPQKIKDEVKTLQVHMQRNLSPRDRIDQSKGKLEKLRRETETISRMINQPNRSTEPKKRITNCQTCIKLSNYRIYLLHEVIKNHIATSSHPHIINDAGARILQSPLRHQIHNALENEQVFLMKDCSQCVYLHELLNFLFQNVHAHFLVQQDDSHFVCYDQSCNRKCFFNAKDLREHWKKVHFIQRNTSPFASKPYYCGFDHPITHETCNSCFNVFSNFKTHQLWHINTRAIFKCLVEECEFTSLTAATLEKHITLLHQPRNPNQSILHLLSSVDSESELPMRTGENVHGNQDAAIFDAAAVTESSTALAHSQSV